MVLNNVQLSVRMVYLIDSYFIISTPISFPLEIVFRIYDHCLANGIEAIFGFSIALLKKNEEQLLGLKFDEILNFLNNRLLDRYMVIVQFLSHTATDSSRLASKRRWQCH